ncbi:hypothetical protein BDN70DRAFT_900528 [Pholiota conissans]|uniref:Myb/SANT-like domain-containing protein n=1 Tax=Pholiota conissans TaxID=109636 RepID=A0A9P5YR78_9AGAR|nr:hypothetical protein BDN70DRAFT_900528 [Pholiota conissans]
MAPSGNTSADKENNEHSSESATRTPRTAWNVNCDKMLLECLEREKADGRMTSNGSFHEDAWKAAEKALSGTQLHSGGARKTSDSCKTRYTALKKSYVQVKTLRNASGFGWNHEKQLVTASDEVWDGFLEVSSLSTGLVNDEQA